MSEEPKPEEEFANLPGPSRNPYATLAIGVTFGVIIGAVLTIGLMPRLTPSMEGRGIVAAVENDTIVIRNVELSLGVDLRNLHPGYIVELEGSVIGLRLGWRKPKENWPMIEGFAP